jgi:hypothetical protein
VFSVFSVSLLQTASDLMSAGCLEFRAAGCQILRLLKPHNGEIAILLPAATQRAMGLGGRSWAKTFVILQTRETNCRHPHAPTLDNVAFATPISEKWAIVPTSDPVLSGYLAIQGSGERSCSSPDLLIPRHDFLPLACYDSSLTNKRWQSSIPFGRSGDFEIGRLGEQPNFGS